MWSLCASTVWVWLLLEALALAADLNELDDSAAADTDALHQIEGRIVRPDHDPDLKWFNTGYITVTGGAGTAFGFWTQDGAFVVSNLPPGSYVVEVTNVRYQFEAVRVDINSRGKMRSRRLNNIQPSEVMQVPYPLKMRPLGRIQFFVKREKWRATDILFNPMVMMMILPVLLIVVLPKMMNDPQTKKEMEQMTMPKYDMPELSEMMTSFFGGEKKAVKPKKKQN